MALRRIDGLGDRTICRLIDEFGSASMVLGMRHLPAALSISAGIRAAIGRARPVPAGVLRLPPGSRALSYGSEEYPEALKRLHTPPCVLFVQGPLDIPRDKAVAVVGTRRATDYGRRVAYRTAADLVASGWTVISGLARGIDAAAHSGALSAGGRTVGVLGCGLGHVYPASNRELYRLLAERGLLVTEHEADVQAAPHHFPRRNRIIAALARAVVVVQAGLPSGALITADLALELGIEVFAVPGPVDVAASRGVNCLLQDGANLATGAADILGVLEGLPAPDAPSSGSGAGEPSDPGSSGSPTDPLPVRLRSMLSDGPAGLDELVRRARAQVPEVLAALGHLEAGGLVDSLPGQRFRLADRP